MGLLSGEKPSGKCYGDVDRVRVTQANNTRRECGVKNALYVKRELWRAAVGFVREVFRVIIPNKILRISQNNILQVCQKYEAFLENKKR